jgi:hypothetical protein
VARNAGKFGYGDSLLLQQENSNLMLTIQTRGIESPHEEFSSDFRQKTSDFLGVMPVGTMMIRRLARAAIIAVLISVVGPLVPQARADALLLNLNPGTVNNFDVVWSLLVTKDGTSTNLEAVGEFTVALSDTSAEFLISLTNNTALVSESIHSIAFDTLPDPIALTDPVAGSVFQNFSLDQKFPSFRTVDICTWTSNTCSGGAQGNNLLGGGALDTFGFSLGGDFTNGLELNNFAIKFQGDLGSYEFRGTPSPRITVPEDDSSASFLLVGIAFVFAFGAGVRRSRTGSTSIS